MALEKIQEIISAQIGMEKELITPEKRLVEDLNVDSLDMVELLMAFEEAFNTSISDELATEIKTVGDIVKLVEKK